MSRGTLDVECYPCSFGAGKRWPLASLGERVPRLEEILTRFACLRYLSALARFSDRVVNAVVASLASSVKDALCPTETPNCEYRPGRVIEL